MERLECLGVSRERHKLCWDVLGWCSFRDVSHLSQANHFPDETIFKEDLLLEFCQLV